MSPTKTKAKLAQGEPNKASFADLGATERDVMVQLAQSRVTANLITLAADLWRTTPDWQAMDPYPLLGFVIDTLCARGLVKFVATKQYASFREEPTNIRLTPEGWAMMGYPNKVVEVGTRWRHDAAPLHTTDGTNYRNQPFTALGDSIEREDFPTHRAHYPDHVHMYGDILMAQHPTATGDSDMARVYFRVTPDIEARIISMRTRYPTLGFADIAERADVPERTVKYVLTDLPRLRRVNAGEAKSNGSLKERIMATVRTLGEIKDVTELRRILGMADDEHSVLHVLHSLHTQGKLDFTERGNGMGTATVVDIRLPKKGKRTVTSNGEAVEPLPVISREQEERAISAAHAVAVTEPEATTPDIPVTASSAPGLDVSEGYPLLDELLDRERNRMERDIKAMAYLHAADALEQVDPEAAAELMRKADAFNVNFPSPLEQEYIRYVAAHPSTGVSK